MTSFSSRAAEKLRRQGSCATQVLVFLHTSPFRKQDRQFSRNIVVPLRSPTADTSRIAQAAIAGIRAIYRPGYNFAKAGVILPDLADAAVVQEELDLDPAPRDRGALMGAMDRLNRRYGRNTVFQASAGVDAGRRRDWQMRQEMRTPAYTTSWEEMPIVRA